MKAWDIVQVGCVIGGLAVLLLLQVPWLDGPIGNIGIRDSESLRTTVIALVLAAGFLETHEVVRRLSQMERSGRKHFVDVMEMYPFMLTRASAIRGRSSRSLDILGTTLYTAWPQVHYWLQRPERSDWVVRLAAVSSSSNASTWTPEEWPEEARANVSSIHKAASSDDFHRRRIAIEVYEYDFLPVVRGFRLGNGDLFISFLRWEVDDRLSGRGVAYEYVPYDEDTASAAALRSLFDSWFDRALRS